MESIRKTFIRGLATILPFLLTIYIIVWGVNFLEDILGSILRRLMPEYIPGLGIVLTLILIYFFGLMLNNFLGTKLLAFTEKHFKQVPVIKAIYSSLKEVTKLFSSDDKREFRRVVLVKVGEHKMLGIVTREEFDHIDAQIAKSKRVAVYLPMSYGLGGFTLLVNKEQIEEVDISTERAFSLAITGWVSVDGKEPK